MILIKDRGFPAFATVTAKIYVKYWKPIKLFYCASGKWNRYITWEFKLWLNYRHKNILSNNVKTEGRLTTALLLKIVCFKSKWLMKTVFSVFCILRENNSKAVSTLLTHNVIYFQSSIKLLFFLPDDSTQVKQGNCQATGSTSICSPLLLSHINCHIGMQHRKKKDSKSWYIWV